MAKVLLDGLGTTGGGSMVLYRPDGQSLGSQAIGIDREFILPSDDNASTLMVL